MNKIFKYYISPGQIFIDAYEDTKIISTGVDPQGDLCIWVIVNPENPPKKIEILCIGTGWDLPEFTDKTYYLQFIGTVKHNIYMWHIFEKINL